MSDFMPWDSQWDWKDFAAGGVAAAGGIAGAISSARQAAKNRRFQEKMYKHRYQYQRDDMLAAGLNPTLMFQNAPPGPPSGSMATFGDLGASAGVSSAMAAREQRELLKRRKNLMFDQNMQVRADTDAKLAQRDLLKEQAATASWNAKSARANNVLAELDASFYRTRTGQALRYGQLGGKAVSDVAGAVGDVIGAALPVGRRFNTSLNVGKNWNSAKTATRARANAPRPTPSSPPTSARKVHPKLQRQWDEADAEYKRLFGE